jgi:hypothetical protein
LPILAKHIRKVASREPPIQQQFRSRSFEALREDQLADTVHFMVKPVDAVQQAIRTLTVAEKEEILAMFLAELDGPADEGVDAAWLKEAERRGHEIDTGAVECIPAEEVFARIDKILGK